MTEQGNPDDILDAEEVPDVENESVEPEPEEE
jgi:hypothetical protein